MNLIARNSFRLRALPYHLSSLNSLRHQATCATTATPSFPCVDAHAARESKILASSFHRYSQIGTPASSSDSGPEPPYARPNPLSYNTYHHQYPLELTYGSTLPSFDIAYETWGTLSPSHDNVILLHTGLSASSHAASTELNPTEGWWEKFIGPGRALDTNQFFIICTNVLGGCYGSTGPSSIDPEGQRYATRFPILSIFDMVQAQFKLLDHLGVQKLYASVGSSMGGMQSLAAGWLFPDRVGKIVSISGTARSSPGSIAMRHAQRSGLLFRHLAIYFLAECHISSHGRSKLEQWLLLRSVTTTYRDEISSS
jgi:pimeloyl-ACP methyl ester carboxylesterase